MILLNTKDYSKVFKPLTKVTINTLFARAVIEQKVAGSVFVDCLDNPQTFYVLHPYGMSLLFGETNNQTFNQHFKEYVLNVPVSRSKEEWMQVYPFSWDTTLKNSLKIRLLISILKQE